MLANSVVIMKPCQHIDGIFCGDGRHKVEEDHAEQGENQVQLPPNPKEEVGLNFSSLYHVLCHCGIEWAPVCKWSKDEGATEEAEH